jgi:hypothetical protein
MKLDVSRYVQSADVAFMWFKADTFVKSKDLPGADYAIAFWIRCDRPFHSVCLAFTILRFSELYISKGESNRFDLVSLCYSFTEDGVYGVLFMMADWDQSFVE